MALFATGDTIKDYTIILLTIVLGAVAGQATEVIPSYTPTVLCSIVILIALEALGNVVAAIKQLAVVEFTIY